MPSLRGASPCVCAFESLIKPYMPNESSFHSPDGTYLEQQKAQKSGRAPVRSSLTDDRIPRPPEATSRVRLTRHFARSISLAPAGFEPGLCSSGPHGSTTAIKAADVIQICPIHTPAPRLCAPRPSAHCRRSIMARLARPLSALP